MSLSASFAELIDGGVLEIGDGYRAKLNELGGDGPIFLRAASVGDGRIDFEGNDRFDGSVADRLQTKLGRPGDTVVTTKGASTGRTAFVTPDAPDFVYSPHLSYWRSRDTDRVDPLFLRYWARGAEFDVQLRGMAASTDMSLYLSLVDQRRLRITIPPIDIQRRTGALLGALDDKIELNRRTNETLERTAKTVFQERFTNATEREAWPREPLARHVAAVRGLSYTGAGLNDSGMPLHNLNSIFEGGGYKRAGIKHFTGEYKERHTVRAGDLIVANTEQGFEHLLIAYPALVPARFGEVGLFSHHLYRLRPVERSPFSRQLLYLLFRYGRVHAEVAGYANGTTVNMLPLEAFQKPEVPAPSPEVAREIDDLVSPLLERIDRNEDESETLAALRDALLPKLISGELCIRSAG